MKIRCIISLLSILFYFGSSAQSSDSLQETKPDHESHYMIHENIPKNKFWGNSWYIAAEYTWSDVHAYDINFGRTFGASTAGGAGISYTMRSYGLGLGTYNFNLNPQTVLKAFWEYCFFWVPPFSVGIRTDYIFDTQQGGHYLRPSLGLSLFFVDVFYGYHFTVNNAQNQFKHGLTFRLKYFIGKKNWQKSYPSRC